MPGDDVKLAASVDPGGLFDLIGQAADAGDQHPDDEWEIVGRVEQRKRVPVVGQVELHHHEVIGDQQDGAARGEGGCR